VACPALRALGMVSKGPLLRLLTAINRRRMKLLVGLACIAYVAGECAGRGLRWVSVSPPRGNFLGPGGAARGERAALRGVAVPAGRGSGCTSCAERHEKYSRRS